MLALASDGGGPGQTLQAWVLNAGSSCFSVPVVRRVSWERETGPGTWEPVQLDCDDRAVDPGRTTPCPQEPHTIVLTPRRAFYYPVPVPFGLVPGRHRLTLVLVNRVVSRELDVTA